MYNLFVPGFSLSRFNSFESAHRRLMSGLKIKMADLRECSSVNEADFYRQIEELKSQLKTKDS